MKLSVVSTLHNSEKYLHEFYDLLIKHVKTLTEEYEIILVDDGSSDGSLRVAMNLMELDSNIRVIELSRNFGHHKAIMTGLENASGHYIFLIDSDLEEPPGVLITFYKEMMDGRHDVVYGYQMERTGGIIKKTMGRFGWFLIDHLYDVSIPHNQSTVRLMNRNYVRSLILHKEVNTVIGGLWAITGYKQFAIAIHRKVNKSTSYSFFHRINILINGITSFSQKPLFLIMIFGCAVMFLSFFSALFAVGHKLLNGSQSGWASLIISIWFFGGAILLSIGIVGIYIAKIFIETKGRPYTIIKEIHSKESHGYESSN